jgi:hypothetical protein
MESIDKYINGIINPQSVGAGVGAVFLSFFTGKLAPTLPDGFYKLLDNTLVRIVVTAYLLNQQIRLPSLSIIIAIIMVIGLQLLVKIFAPSTPPLSELIKSATGGNEDEKGKTGKTEEKGEKQPQGCNCYCGHTIYTDKEKPLEKDIEHFTFFSRHT